MLFLSYFSYFRFASLANNYHIVLSTLIEEYKNNAVAYHISVVIAGLAFFICDVCMRFYHICECLRLTTLLLFDAF